MAMTKDNALIALGYPGKKRSFFDTLTVAEIRYEHKWLIGIGQFKLFDLSIRIQRD